MLHARGRLSARVRLTGSWNGTLPVTMRQKQPIPVLASDFTALQQSAVGVVPLAELLVTKLKHGMKLEIREAEHGVTIWLWVGTVRNASPTKSPMNKTTSSAGVGLNRLILRWMLCLEMIGWCSFGGVEEFIRDTYEV